MFSLKSGDDLVFGTSSISKPDKLIPDDLIADPDSNFLQTASEIQWRKQFGMMKSKRNNKDKDNIRRRIIHRDLERQRRQQMSHLYASLCSRLPLDHIKGKVSVSDYLQEAMNYIKHKKNRVEELKIQRDEIKKQNNLPVTEIGSSNGSNNMPNNVTVNVHLNIVEILIDSSDQFELSKVLKELIQRQLNVFNCVSTKANERFLHKIQAEAGDLTSLDLSILQERMNHIIK